MGFWVSDISENTLHRMKRCGMLDHVAAMPLSRLKEVFIKHYNFTRHISEGSVIVMDVLAEDCKDLFQALFDLKFPIYSVLPICHFDASDEISMSNNNSSAYNPRLIAGTSDISIHAYGAALDINPVQNPYVKLGDLDKNDLKIYPAAGKAYLNRHHQQSGMVEDIVSSVQKAGFTIWGGDWTDRRIDYHHFQVPLLVAYLCSEFDRDNAYAFYKIFKDNPAAFSNIEDGIIDKVKIIMKKKTHLQIINDLDNHLHSNNNISLYFDH